MMWIPSRMQSATKDFHSFHIQEVLVLMKKTLLFALLLCLLCACALAQDTAALVPAAMPAASLNEPVALYCGATQGFYRHMDQTIDLTQPFVCFGQYDCWTMVAQGTPDAFGPVGWIEGGLFDESGVPELSFEDGFAAMIEEDAAVTNDPLNPDSLWGITLPRGTQITVLAGYGDWLYVQTEIDGAPARVFVPAGVI